jgi:hypothetical protein
MAYGNRRNNRIFNLVSIGSPIMNNERVHPTIDRHGNPCQSLTKREYFAAMAMQGLLSNSVWIENVLKKDINHGVALATASVESADALISEMERTKS